MTKKLLSLFAILSVVLLFSACEGPRGLDGLNGLDGQPGQPGPPGAGGFNRKVFNLNVEKGYWIWDENAQEYYQDFDAPEITSYVNSSGKIFGDELVATNTYEPCPSTIYFYDEDSKTDLAETLTFDHSVGTIRVKLRALDSFYNTPTTYQPKTKSIRIIAIW